MRRIYYASGSVLTDDAIARAVLEYAEALAKDGRADIVEVPVVLASGNLGTATMLIGPSSQLASVTEESDLVPPSSDVLVEDITRRTRLLGSPHPASNQYADFLTSSEDYE
jgi:hypothetical protein